MFGKNLKEIRSLKNYTMDEVVEKINSKYDGIIHINKGNLSKWENDKAEPMLSTVRILADFYGLCVDDLVNGNFNQPASLDINSVYNKLEFPRKAKVFEFAEQQLEEQNKVVSIEETQTVYLNSKLSAGTGILDLDPTDTKEIEYSGYVPKHDLAFEVSGNSMEPSFGDGEIVFVEKTPDVYNGQFIAVQINEEAYIKKAYIEDERLRLVSLNRDYKDIYACGNDDIRVIGRIIL